MLVAGPVPGLQPGGQMWLTISRSAAPGCVVSGFQPEGFMSVSRQMKQNKKLAILLLKVPFFDFDKRVHQLFEYVQ